MERRRASKLLRFGIVLTIISVMLLIIGVIRIGEDNKARKQASDEIAELERVGISFVPGTVIDFREPERIQRRAITRVFMYAAAATGAFGVAFILGGIWVGPTRVRWN